MKKKNDTGFYWRVVRGLTVGLVAWLVILNIVYGGERPKSAPPSQAPPIDERLTGIESRVNSHDSEILELQQQIEALRLAIKCPCGRGGKCICPPDSCLCPNCPEHHKGKATISETKVLFFTADWCTPCQQVKKQLGSLMDKIEIVDCTNGNPKPEYGVTAYPTFVKLTDGKEVSRTVGANKSIVAGWLAESKVSSSEIGLPSEAQPTPWSEVQEGLKLLNPKSSEVLADFGCGYDARLLIHAARYHDVKKLVGVEIDEERADSAKRHVNAAGLDNRITVLEGDATKIEVDANVGMAYLWPDTLRELRPEIEKLDRFASYIHAVPGLEMTKRGNWYLWEKNTPVKAVVRQTQRSQPVYYNKPSISQPVYYNTGASWGGRTHSAPVCNSPYCSMCNAIRQQLYYR